jgi:hypothetical protein
MWLGAWNLVHTCGMARVSAQSIYSLIPHCAEVGSIVRRVI